MSARGVGRRVPGRRSHPAALNFRLKTPSHARLPSRSGQFALLLGDAAADRGFALRPWGELCIGQPVEAAPREPNDRPYVVSADAPWLAAALQSGWDTATYESVVRAFG